VRDVGTQRFVPLQRLVAGRNHAIDLRTKTVIAVDNLWLILVQFIFRTTFGLSLAMGVTPSSKVTSGYYRVHLWVLMGLNTFAALALFSAGEGLGKSLSNPTFAKFGLGLAVFLAIACYIGAVVWLYEKAWLGEKWLYVIALVALAAAAVATPWRSDSTAFGNSLVFLDFTSSGMMLGTILAAMFLGHWYLNTPTMELVPLKRLILFMMVSIGVRALLCGIGLGAQILYSDPLSYSSVAFVVMRWASGLAGTLLMAVMAWQTLKIPNTQSATGILYVAVILVFVGELFSQLLSVSSHYPL
jgi:hypothetical protein